MSNTTKLYGYTGGVILLILLAIAFAIKPTFNLYSDIEQLNTKLKINGNLDKEIELLQKALKPLNASENKINWEDYNQYALAEITESCSKNKVKIIQFKPTLTKNYQDYKVNLFKVELQGSYIRLLKTLKTLEHITELGEIISTQFYLHKERKIKKESVHLVIHLSRLEQNISK